MRFSKFLCLVILFAGVLINTPSAIALEPNAACLENAKDKFEDCKAVCQQDFQSDKESCSNTNQNCAEKCGTDHEACIEQSLEDSESCKQICQKAVEEAKESCRDLKGGTPARRQCIEIAQTTFMLCRDNCRDDVRDDFKQCNTILSDCLKVCH